MIFVRDDLFAFARSARPQQLFRRFVGDPSLFQFRVIAVYGVGERIPREHAHAHDRGLLAALGVGELAEVVDVLMFGRRKTNAEFFQVREYGA